VQRLRIRYAKRGRLRFSSHRDVARAFERALRRAGVPMAFSAGFSPHPKISYAGAAPTGVSSEAEYLEIGLAAPRDPQEVRAALDAALPPGIDVVAVVVAELGDSPLAGRIEASSWRVQLPGVTVADARAAVDRLLALASAPVERLTKDGRRTVDARAAILVMAVEETAGNGVSTAEQLGSDSRCATLNLVVRHTTPAVRPDDVLTALRAGAALTTPVTPVVTRLAQGLLDATPSEGPGRLLDPFDSSDAAAVRVP
jgi:radical SAM-linked protein